TKKSTNCIIFDTQNDSNENEQLPCIRCSECEIACPIGLLPQQLYWYSTNQQWDALQQQDLFDCIECGACSYVCPSKIPLVTYYQFAKSEIKHQNLAQQKSELAKQRYDNRQERLLRIKKERDEKRRKTAETRKLNAINKQQDPDGKKSAIAAALQRVKNKKGSHN
ncbi:MAG: 4Fe-4S dicluster domain-containing protein, partial [Kangiellaceae bacterium]|nr:4Fe-4S dicluster domain-containing protein [Kangiellaceae bacterium]